MMVVELIRRSGHSSPGPRPVPPPCRQTSSSETWTKPVGAVPLIGQDLVTQLGERLRGSPTSRPSPRTGGFPTESAHRPPRVAESRAAETALPGRHSGGTFNFGPNPRRPAPSRSRWHRPSTRRMRRAEPASRPAQGPPRAPRRDHRARAVQRPRSEKMCPAPASVTAADGVVVMRANVAPCLVLSVEALVTGACATRAPPQGAGRDGRSLVSGRNRWIAATATGVARASSRAVRALLQKLPMPLFAVRFSAAELLTPRVLVPTVRSAVPPGNDR